jgi:hypothetical protein
MDHYETGLTGRLWEERRVADEACCSERLPHLSWPDRIEHYHHTTGNPQSLFMGGDGRVAGIFIMGNDYRVKSEYHGGYPATYLKRIKALFPDKRRVLHLFSGRVDLDLFPGDTVDINPGLNPTYLDDEVRHHNGQAEHRRGQSRTPGAWHSRCVAGTRCCRCIGKTPSTSRRISAWSSQPTPGSESSLFSGAAPRSAYKCTK